MLCRVTVSTRVWTGSPMNCPRCRVDWKIESNKSDINSYLGDFPVFMRVLNPCEALLFVLSIYFTKQNQNYCEIIIFDDLYKFQHFRDEFKHQNMSENTATQDSPSSSTQTPDHNVLLPDAEEGETGAEGGH